MFVVLSFNIDLWSVFRPNILSKLCCLCSYDVLYENCHSFPVYPSSSIANTICWRLLSAFISELKSLVFISISVTQGSNQYLTKGQWSVKDFRKGTRVYCIYSCSFSWTISFEIWNFIFSIQYGVQTFPTIDRLIWYQLFWIERATSIPIIIFEAFGSRKNMN